MEYHKRFAIFVFVYQTVHGVRLTRAEYVAQHITYRLVGHFMRTRALTLFTDIPYFRAMSFSFHPHPLFARPSRRPSAIFGTFIFARFSSSAFAFIIFPRYYLLLLLAFVFDEHFAGDDFARTRHSLLICRCFLFVPLPATHDCRACDAKNDSGTKKRNASRKVSVITCTCAPSVNDMRALLRVDRKN